MKIKLILFFCIGLQYMAFSQTPSKADSLRAEGNLVGAIAEYDKLYQIDSTNSKNIYKYACAYALLKQRDSAFYFLNKATVGDSTLNALTEPDFYFLIEDERWETFTVKEVAKVEAKHGKYPNLELSRKLWTMVIKDQAFYYQLKLATKQWGYKSPMVRVVWELKKKLNTQNLAELKEIIAEIGWPKKSEVKGMGASAAFLIVQHAELETQKKYLPLMRAAADAGEANWYSLALLIDRVNIGEGKKQIYGSQVSGKPDGTYEVMDLEEPEYVNQRRKKVGLGPIEKYVKRWGIEWTIEQKEKE